MWDQSANACIQVKFKHLHLCSLVFGYLALGPVSCLKDSVQCRWKWRITLSLKIHVTEQGTKLRKNVSSVRSPCCWLQIQSINQK